jgi:flagellin
MANTGTTNTAANTALRYLAINNSSASSSLAKLSSGSRIVKASDDAPPWRSAPSSRPT